MFDDNPKVLKWVAIAFFILGTLSLIKLIMLLFHPNDENRVDLLFATAGWFYFGFLHLDLKRNIDELARLPRV